MNYIIIFGYLLFSQFTMAIGPVYPKDAIKYLTDLDCSFSAYAAYLGPDVSSMIGSLKKGQAYTNAICSGSYEEGGAKKHEFCWLRIVDMKKGVYIGGKASYGSAKRDESGPCTRSSIIKILSNIRGELSFGKDKEWRIVRDKFSAVPDFKKLIDGTLMEEEYNKLKFGKYRWLYWTFTNECADKPGSADDNITDPNEPSKIVTQDENKLVLQVRKDKWTYFSSKSNCEKEVKKHK